MKASTSACELNSGRPAASSDFDLAVLGFENLCQAHIHLVDDRLRRDAVLFVVCTLDCATAIGLTDCLLHGVGHAVGVENCTALEVASGTTHGLDQRSG